MDEIILCVPFMQHLPAISDAVPSPTASHTVAMTGTSQTLMTGPRVREGSDRLPDAPEEVDECDRRAADNRRATRDEHAELAP